MAHNAGGLNQVQSSTSSRRMGVVFLALMVATYLTAITVSFAGELDSAKRVVIFAFLWLLGLGAFGLLARAWRRRNEADAV